MSGLSPQKMQQIQEQEIEGLLRAPAEFGTNKLLLNVNGQNSILPTNKNSIVKYTLKQPVKLDIGDRVTLIESFVEERGLSIDTVSIEEDIEEELRFLYYQQGDCQNNIGDKAGKAPYTGIAPDQKFASFPNVNDLNVPFLGWNPSVFENPINQEYPFFSSMLGAIGLQSACLPALNYTGTAQPNTPIAPVSGQTIPAQFKYATIGATGQYYYMMEWYNPEVPGSSATALNADPKDMANSTSKLFMRPVYGSATIKVPAGNYSVSALSDLINNQLNGFLQPNPENPTGLEGNSLTNKLFNNPNTFNSIQSYPFFNGVTQSLIDDESNLAEYNPDTLIIGEDTHQAYQRRRGNIMTKVFFNECLTGEHISLQSLCEKNTRAPLDFVYGGRNTQWAFGNGQGVVGSGKDPEIWNFGGSYSTPIDLATTFDKSLFNSESPDRVIFRRFGTNFFLNLGGLRTAFEGDNCYYNPTNQNIDDYHTNRMPSLSDMLLAKLGTKGQYYYGTQPSATTMNSRYPENAADDTKFFRYPDCDLVEMLTFSSMFVVCSSDNTIYNGNAAHQTTPFFNGGAYQQYAGTSTFNIAYDTTSANRFSIKNLHEPYKLSNVTPKADAETHLGGQQATKFNTPIFFHQEEVTPVTNPKTFKFKEQRELANFSGAYPVDTQSGVAVNNFSFNSVKNTRVYKDLVSNIQTLNTSNVKQQFKREKLIYDLFTKPYEKFFDSDTTAKEAWSKTLWARIGFSYEQLGKVENNLETIFTFANLPTSLNPFNGETQAANQEASFLFKPPPVDSAKFFKQMGIVTHNSFNFTFIPSSNGLGTANPIGGQYQVQGYDLRGYTTATTEDATPSDNGFGIQQNAIHILGDSQPINAEDFPSLNDGNNYLIIESDIVKPNAKDATSNPTTIVGIMSKENASNDTIFSVNPVTFTVTEPKLLSTIEVQIKNPDGTLVSDEVVGKNNAFIFQVEKAIAPAAMTLEGF